jgi:dihydroxyacetone kinase phosphotransfer subunit
MVGLMLVGHSADVVRGVVAMVAQAAPGVPVDGAGGLRGGRLGTDALAVADALRRVLRASDDGVLVLVDLGSAAMAVDLAIDELDAEEGSRGGARARVRVSEAPFVEGAVVAAVEAAAGRPLEAVAAAAERALAHPKLPRG